MVISHPVATVYTRIYLEAYQGLTTHVIAVLRIQVRTRRKVMKTKLVTLAIILALLSLSFYWVKGKVPIFNKKPIGMDLIVESSDIKVVAKGVKIIKKNNRGDMKIIPVKGEVTVKGVTYPAVISIEPGTIKNEPSSRKLVVYTQGIGCTYEIFHLGDFNLNLGVGLTMEVIEPILDVGYNLNQHTEVFIGTTGKLIIGIGVRF